MKVALSTTSGVQRVRFDIFELDEESGELFRDGIRLPIQEQPLTVLRALLQVPGHVVTRDTLCQKLWADHVHVDYDHGLNAAVRRLRETLGDDPHDPRIVETLPRRGYRLKAPVTRERAGLGELWRPAAALSICWLRNSVGVSRTYIGLPAITAVGLLVLSTLVLGGRRPARSIDEPGILSSGRLTAVTLDTGYHASPSWTAEAALVVYEAELDTNVDLWLRHARGGPPTRLTEDPSADWQPAVSPDGSLVAFRSERDGGGLFVMPVLGGPVHRLTNFGYLPQWSPDGSRLLFAGRLARTTEGIPSLYVVSLAGGSPRPVADALSAVAPEYCCYRGAAWHPDSRRISTLVTDLGRRWTLTTHDLAKSVSIVSQTADALAGKLEADLPLAHDRHFGSLAWAPTADAVYFLAYSDGVRAIWRLPVDRETLRLRGSPQRITTGPSSIRDFTLSTSGKHLVFSTYEDSTKVCKLPRDQATGLPHDHAEPVTVGEAVALAPDVSPDGAYLAYVATHRGRRHIRVRELASGVDEALVEPDEFDRTHPRWSSDGTTLTYSRRLVLPEPDRAQACLAMFSLTRRRESQVTTPGSPVGVAQAWSATSQLLVVGYQSNAGSRRAVVALLDSSAAPAAERSIRVVASDPDANLYAQDMSRDGEWIGFNKVQRVDRSDTTSRLFVTASRGGPRIPVTAGGEWEDKLTWSPDGKFIYFVSDASGFFNVWGRRFDPVNGQIVGEAFRVTNFAGPAKGMPPTATAASLNIAVSSGFFLVPVIERRGSIWSLEIHE